MKIIKTSNFDLEIYPQSVVAENVPEYCVDCIVSALNARFSGSNHPDHYCKVPDDHVLWRGMEDLI